MMKKKEMPKMSKGGCAKGYSSGGAAKQRKDFPMTKKPMPSKKK